MRHRVYKLRNRLSLFGLDAADWAVVLATWLLVLQTVAPLAGPRGRLLVTAIATLAVHRAWSAVKDRVPERFFLHLVLWVAEREVNRALPDTRLAPVVVDPARLPATRPAESA